MLEYNDTKKAYKHIGDDDKKILEDFNRADLAPLVGNEKNSIFINESGLYSLILSSKKEEAKKFKKWVTSEVLPSIRKHGEYKLKKEMETITNNLQEQLKINKKQKQKIKTLSATNNTLENFVNNVKTKNKSSYIYIATSKTYASQNIFKVGKTDNLKNRLSGYNTNHTGTDRFYYAYFEKVYNSNKIESIILDLLDDFRDKKDKEIIILHYSYLLELIKLVIKNINEPYEYLNNLIKNKLISMYNLKPIVPKEILLDNLELLELKNKIIKLLDDCIQTNNLNLSRKELIDRLELTESNKIELWNSVKKVIKWVNSKTPIVYKNTRLMITY